MNFSGDVQLVFLIKFENPRWRPFFKMATILHLQVKVGPKKIINLTYLGDLLYVLLYVLKVSGIISCSFDAS